MGDWHIQHKCMPQALCAFSPFFYYRKKRKDFITTKMYIIVAWKTRTCYTTVSAENHSVYSI